MEKHFVDYLIEGDNYPPAGYVSFDSSDHIRFQNGKDVSGHNYGCNRRFVIEKNIEGGEGYTVTMYNLDGLHPLWKDNIQMAMFAAYVEAPDNPKLLSKHLVDAISMTVPLSTTMKEQIAALRSWAVTRAKNASSDTSTDEKKEMPILLTRPELELERSFDLGK